MGKMLVSIVIVIENLLVLNFRYCEITCSFGWLFVILLASIPQWFKYMIDF